MFKILIYKLLRRIMANVSECENNIEFQFIHIYSLAFSPLKIIFDINSLSVCLSILKSSTPRITGTSNPFRA